MNRIKMFLSRLVVVFLAAYLLVGCNSSNNQDRKDTTASNGVKMEQPTELGMSKDSLDSQVRQKGINVAANKESKLVEEAGSALNDVSIALKALANNDNKVAFNSLESATGKLEILLARDPNLALVPLDMEVSTQDFVADLETIESIKKAARKAIRSDHFQSLRDEISNLASEIRVERVQLPLTTFPGAMKEAAALIDEGKQDVAEEVLNEAMNTLVIEEIRIPLPILRAEVLINQAKNEDSKTEDKNKEVLQLMDNAEYQLILAEELGYGKRDKEFGELNKSIKELKKTVKSGGDSQGLFEELQEKIAKFNKRMVA